MEKKIHVVLLIDDDQEDNDWHRTKIEQASPHVKVHSINNPLKALDCWKKSCSSEDREHPLPDIVLLDTNMPALNGFQLLDEIRKVPDPNKRLKQIRIFMLSTSFNLPPNISRESYEDLISGYYAKPFTAEMFREILKRYF